MPTHQWFLEVIPRARQEISELPSSKQRMAVFASIRELLLADNPTAVHGVRKLVGGHFKDQWRQRQGDYRIFFSIDPTPVAHERYNYKGTVQILAVLHRGKAY